MFTLSFMAHEFYTTVKTFIAGSPESACFDLFAAEAVLIPPGGRYAVSTGISMCFPRRMMGKIYSLSSLAHHYGVDVVAGVIDGDYMGTVKVCLHNTSKNDFPVREGDRIGQIAFMPVHCPEMRESHCLPKLTRKSQEIATRGSGPTDR